MLGFLLVLIVVGLIAGAIARLLVPGRDPLGLLGTIILGVLGSFLGGFLENVILFHTLTVTTIHTAGIIGSAIGAIIILLFMRLLGRRGTRYRRRRF